MTKMRLAQVVSILSAMILMPLVIVPAQASGPWYVTTDGIDSNDCLSPSTACATINGAIGKASSSDAIYIATGTYSGTGSEVVLINKSIFLIGGWDSSFITRSGFSIIDGENARRGIKITNEAGQVSIERFIVQNGRYDGAPGIFSEGDLTLYECIVRDNVDIGGWTSEGGGVRSTQDLQLTKSIVHGNTSPSGAGIFNAWGNVLVNNSTISGNSASGHGGGINNLGGNVVLQNSTVTNNNDTSGGGGIHNEAGGSVILLNSILAGNYQLPIPPGGSPDCGGTISSLGYNLIGSTDGCAFTPTTGDMINIDPLLDTLQDNGGPTLTHALLEGSPAIDAGNNSTCESSDQRGIARPIDGDYDGFSICDIGAFELDPPTFVDVPYDYWAWQWIEALYNSGITSGCSTDPPMYCPDSSVTRAQMAVFLERGMRGSGYNPPPASGTVFDDVPVSHWAAAWIEQLASDGITGGCSTDPPLYCPESSVTRAQMAIFLERAMHWPTPFTPPPASGTVFDDVPVDHWAAAWIEQLAADGITGGCSASPPMYCPENPVTRAQMAVFLVRIFNLPMP